MGFPNMIEVYAGLVKAGKKTIDEVPERDELRIQVQKKLDEDAAARAVQEEGTA